MLKVVVRVLEVVVEVEALEQEAPGQVVRVAPEQVALEQVGPDMVGVNLPVEKVVRVRVVVSVRTNGRQVAWAEETTLLKMRCVYLDNVDLSMD